jgi:hypothetical protein
MPGGEGRLDALFGQNAPGGYADGEDGRLCVFRQSEILVRAFKDQLGERKTEGFIGFGEGLRGDGEVVGEVAAHANGLRTLARKEKSESGRHFRKDFIVLASFAIPGQESRAGFRMPVFAFFRSNRRPLHFGRDDSA